jgi:hypothetical protein
MGSVFWSFVQAVDSVMIISNFLQDKCSNRQATNTLETTRMSNEILYQSSLPTITVSESRPSFHRWADFLESRPPALSRCPTLLHRSIAVSAVSRSAVETKVTPLPSVLSDEFVKSSIHGLSNQACIALIAQGT